MGVLITNLSLFTGDSLIGQVTMKEKPTFTQRTVREVSSTRTMHISACWNSASFAQLYVYRSLEPYNEQCDSWSFSGSWSLSGDVPLCAGEYDFNFQIAVDVPLGQSFPAYFKASIGADTVINESTVFGNYGNQGPLYTPWNLPPYANPLPSRFKLTVGATVLYENPLILSISSESDCSYDSWDPARDSVSIQIVSGANYVSWHTTSRDKISGPVVTGLAAKINNFILVADGHLPPDSGATVVLEATGNGITRTTSVAVKPYHLSVLVDPPLVPVGQKARIIVQMVDADGAPYTPLLFPYARLRITDSTQYGTLWYGDFWGYFSESGDSLSDVIIDGPDAPLGRAMKFLANEQSPADSVQVHFTVEKTGDCCTIYPRQPWYLYPYDGLDTVRASGVVTVKNNDILLGETKYYQATLDPFDYSTVIKEYSTPQDSDLSGVEFHVDTVSASKLGVYYEYKDSTGDPLPTDQIRLVGRYWQKDSTYRVRLRAIYGDTASIVIEVKKPTRLLSLKQAPSYSKSKDIVDSTINIDSICVFYGGKFGIPPQFIKGEMLQESQTHGFTGFSGFAPSYRYEPYTTQTGMTTRKWKNNAYYVTDDGNMGSPCVPSSSCPPGHLNVFPMPYPTAAQSVWDFVSAHSRLGNPNNSDGTYGVIAIDGTIDLGSSYPTLQLNYVLEYLAPAIDGANITTISDNIQTANRNFINYLRTSWGKIGMDSMKAQTRIASSYGLLQLTYDRAIKIKYPADVRGANGNVSHRPEDLNATNVSLDLAMVNQSGLLYKAVGSFSNWDEGFENGFRLYVYAKWNTNQTYPQEVLDKSQLFKPMR